ncbi:hypothetical protein CLV24_10526 [Pontibacter ummariensis]|uniref:Uncharacterized protein n=1 Tax=Pontibacter ummariensis TaxID=1610492 RepID=A0A239E113_9BACT|nr:DUF6334 family protein [Pontibacter ummariensis]PRY13656.1 hypothetical protein CLV24_10526 [Pontibacter ummariensis]SNS38189.1 hypothetical protein SAMN06296052_105225 [Pontibacter ummariensis]
MESIIDLEALTGKEVRQAFALYDLDHGWLEQVVFQVEDVFLAVAVDMDYDEVTVSVLPELDLRALEQQFSRRQISNQRKRISYIWRMMNQRGYEDAFQLEFDDLEGTNVQLLAENAQLRLSIFQRYR